MARRSLPGISVHVSVPFHCQALFSPSTVITVPSMPTVRFCAVPRTRFQVSKRVNKEGSLLSSIRSSFE